MDDREAYEYYLDPEHQVPGGPPVRRKRPRGPVPGTSRALDQVVSVRMDASALTQVRQIAAADGVSVSDWIRNAARLELIRRGQAAMTIPGYVLAGWRCEHFAITSIPGTLGRATCGAGCDMLPVYENMTGNSVWAA